MMDYMYGLFNFPSKFKSVNKYRSEWWLYLAEKQLTVTVFYILTS